MPDIIMHHYPLSPFSEKVRLALGIKGLDYRSVTIPVWMPKPDLLPLTGNYRRTPVMQIGADIYCDTLLILREIERRHPQPSLFPGGTEAICAALEWWAEKFMFMPAVGLACSLMGEHFPDALIEERKPFFGVSLDKASMQRAEPSFLQQLHAHLGTVARMLADGRAFLLGAAPSAADLSAYHPLWFARKNGGPAVDGLLPLAPVHAWYDRVASLGHGHPHDLSATDALAIAADATPQETQPGAGTIAGVALGQAVQVTPDDTGRDPVAGELVTMSELSVTIRRRDPRVGTVHVHFPRAGFDIVPAR